MTDDKREKYCLAMQQGMQAMNEEQMAQRAKQQQAGMQNAALPSAAQQDAMRNFWGAYSDPRNAFIPMPPKLSLFQRLRDKLARKREKERKT